MQVMTFKEAKTKCWLCFITYFSKSLQLEMVRVNNHSRNYMLYNTDVGLVISRGLMMDANTIEA